MSKVFDRAWAVVKATPEDDVEPDEGFHQLNDPNPTIAFGAAVRNHPFVAEMMRQREEAYSKPYSEGGAIHECVNCGKTTDTNYFDIYDDEHCCKRCSEGDNPWCANLMDGENKGPHMCEFELVGNPTRSTNGYGGYYVELHCPKCDNYIGGDVY